MSLKIGRLGFLGLGIESSPGTVVPSTTTIPFINNTIQGKHTPIEDIAARASRAQDFNSVQGKMWSEGEIDVNVDSLNVGYLLKLGLGNEIVNTVVSGVYDHIFYTTISGNAPTTATLYDYKGVDTMQFPSVAVDKMDLEIKDALMTAKLAVKGQFPTSGSHTPTTVSGTLISFGSYSMQLGGNLAVAGAASAKAITEFQLSVQNNLEVIFESGQSKASRIFWKQLKVTGSFTQFFETVTERDNYFNLNKQSIIVTASGIAFNGYNEQLKISLGKVVYTDASIATGLENYFAIKTNFTAEVDLTSAKSLEIILRNWKSSAYS